MLWPCVMIIDRLRYSEQFLDGSRAGSGARRVYAVNRFGVGVLDGSAQAPLEFRSGEQDATWGRRGGRDEQGQVVVYIRMEGRERCESVTRNRKRSMTFLVANATLSRPRHLFRALHAERPSTSARCKVELIPLLVQPLPVIRSDCPLAQHPTYMTYDGTPAVAPSPRASYAGERCVRALVPGAGTRAHAAAIVLPARRSGAQGSGRRAMPASPLLRCGGVGVRRCRWRRKGQRPEAGVAWRGGVSIAGSSRAQARRGGEIKRMRWVWVDGHGRIAMRIRTSISLLARAIGGQRADGAM
ncbi:hypothetical protein BKA93DRAFT_880393 [Sparassis latifolia]